MQDKGTLQAVIDRTAELLFDWIKKLLEVVGPLGEPVSNADQMAAYLALTSEDKVKLQAEYGSDFLRFEAQMEARIKLSGIMKRVLAPDTTLQNAMQEFTTAEQ